SAAQIFLVNDRMNQILIEHLDPAPAGPDRRQPNRPSTSAALRRSSPTCTMSAPSGSGLQLRICKRGIFDLNGAWGNHIAKANVDLHWDSSASKGCVEANPHALVLGILLYPGDLYRLCIEFNRVRFGFELANFSDQNTNVLKFVAHSPEEIDIHRGTCERCSPGGQQ